MSQKKPEQIEDPFLSALIEDDVNPQGQRISTLTHTIEEDTVPSSGQDDDPHLGLAIGDFSIVERIAIGGMGYIYRAQHKEDPKDLRAIKVLREEFAKLDPFVERFQREARILEKISHPRVIKLYEHGYLDELGHFMSLEWLHGFSLKDKYRESRQLFDQKLIYRWAEQLGHALHFVHQNDIIHRDVKPDNVFLIEHMDVTSEGTDGLQKSLRLIDFGIACDLAEDNNFSEIVGTPRYMAPEQILGEVITPRADLYAFGNMLFEMLTRRPVFNVTKSEDLKKAHIEQTPPTLAQVRPDLMYPQELENIIKRLLAKKPTDRPASIPDFFQELGSVLLCQQIERRKEKKKGGMGIVVGGQPKPPEDSEDPTPPPTVARAAPKQSRDVVALHTEEDTRDVLHAIADSQDALEAVPVKVTMPLCELAKITAGTTAGAHSQDALPAVSAESSFADAFVGEEHLAAAMEGQDDAGDGTVQPVSVGMLIVFFLLFVGLAGGMGWVVWHFFLR